MESLVDLIDLPFLSGSLGKDRAQPSAANTPEIGGPGTQEQGKPSHDLDVTLHWFLRYNSCDAMHDRIVAASSYLV